MSCAACFVSDCLRAACPLALREAARPRILAGRPNGQQGVAQARLPGAPARSAVIERATRLGPAT